MQSTTIRIGIDNGRGAFEEKLLAFPNKYLYSVPVFPVLSFTPPGMFLNIIISSTKVKYDKEI